MKPFNIFRKKRVEVVTDLTPRGVAKSIIPEGHGTADHFNEAWTKIYSQRRNLNLIEK